MGALRRMVRNALRERDAARAEGSSADARAEQLARDVDVLGAWRERPPLPLLLLLAAGAGL